MSNASNLESALDYARRGLPVFPAWPVLPMLPPRTGFMCGCGSLRCKDQGKHPIGRLVRNGLKNASSDQAQVAHWWAARRDANPAIATEGLIVVDADPRHDGFDTMQKLVRKHGKLSPSWRVSTGGGGWHGYFRDPTNGQIRNSANVIGPGVDIRATGGYVIAPPSNHVSGGFYEWYEECSPADLPLADAPDWLVESLQKASTNAEGNATPWHALANQAIGEGGRNNALTRVTGHLFRRYVAPELTLALVRCWNHCHCQPPLDDAEVIKIVNSIAAKELRRRDAHG